MDEKVKYGSSIEYNKKKLQYIQDFTSLVFGTSAGILQLESANGFAYFLIETLVINVLFVVITAELKPGKFFQSPLKEIFVDGFARSVAAFLMMWTLTYALVQG